MTGASATAESAARLVALGMRPKQLPARDAVYADLVLRYGQDDEFKTIVQAVAAGLGLIVLAVTRQSGSSWPRRRTRSSKSRWTSMRGAPRSVDVAVRRR